MTLCFRESLFRKPKFLYYFSHLKPAFLPQKWNCHGREIVFLISVGVPIPWAIFLVGLRPE
jgi:hypothetical protein